MEGLFDDLPPPLPGLGDSYGGPAIKTGQK